jgi:4,5-dihydroxyphthalate decarboxylase
VVIKTAIVDSAPRITAALFDAFKASKAAYLSRLKAGGDTSPADAAARELDAVVGDPFPFGVEANRKALEAMVRFAVEQRVIPKPLGIEELFAPSMLTR